MNQKLKDYITGKTNYTRIMNIIMNNRSKNWYDILGRYIVDNIDISKEPQLMFYADKLKEKSSLSGRIKNFTGFIDRTYSSIAIFFITSVLDEKALQKMFGNPYFHSEFGEGFDDEYDEETDEYIEPTIKDSYASYFVNVGGTNFHIGYDHRGTNIEIEIPNKFNYDSGFSDEEAKRCFESLKKLVDLYKEKCVK